MSWKLYDGFIDALQFFELNKRLDGVSILQHFSGSLGLDLSYRKKRSFLVLGIVCKISSPNLLYFLVITALYCYSHWKGQSIKLESHCGPR